MAEPRGWQPRGEFREGGRRRERPRRDFDQRQPTNGEETGSALPAFITGGQPVVPAAPQADQTDQVVAESGAPSDEQGGEGYGRRRRRYGRYGRGGAEQGDAPAPEPEVAPGE